MKPNFIKVLLLLKHFSMPNYNIAAQLDGTYDVTVVGDFIFQGTFADAVTTYCQDAETFEKYNAKSGFNLKGIISKCPLAEMEQVIVALWSTIPKFYYSKKYRQMLREVSLVVNYFQNGDLSLFEEAVLALEDHTYSDPDPVEILLGWEDFLAEITYAPPIKVAEEDNLVEAFDQEKREMELSYVEVE